MWTRVHSRAYVMQNECYAYFGVISLKMDRLCTDRFIWTNDRKTTNLDKKMCVVYSHCGWTIPFSARHISPVRMTMQLWREPLGSNMAWRRKGITNAHTHTAHTHTYSNRFHWSNGFNKCADQMILITSDITIVMRTGYLIAQCYFNFYIFCFMPLLLIQSRSSIAHSMYLDFDPLSALTPSFFQCALPFHVSLSLFFFFYQDWIR